MSLQVQLAQPQDYAAWLALAGQAEDLFGPMVNRPDFQQTLLKHLGRGTAFCVREDVGPPGAPLLGGLLFSPKPPTYKISWLVVSQPHQRQGLGKLLVDRVIALVQPPAEMVVTTFGPSDPGGPRGTGMKSLMTALRSKAQRPA